MTCAQFYSIFLWWIKKGSFTMLHSLLFDKQFRTVTSTKFAIIINILSGFAKLLFGLILQSTWFVVTAIYYLILSGARIHNLYRMHSVSQIDDSKQQDAEELIFYRRSGVFVCGLAISYLVICLRMYIHQETNHYSGLVIYGVALIALSKTTMAISGIITHRNFNNPMLSSLKKLSLIDALLSIVMICYAVAMNGREYWSIENSALFSSACGVVFFIMGILMIRKKRDE